MGLKRRITRWLDRPHCKKLIQYNGHTIEFKDSEVGVTGVKFKIGDFKIDPKKVRESSELADAIDDYQYLVCLGTGDLQEDDREKYIKLRLAIVGLLTALRGTLAAFKADPKGEKKNLAKIVSTMQDINTKQVKEAQRAMRAGRKPRLTGVPKSAANAIPSALKISGVKPAEANKFAKQLSAALETTKKKR